MFGQGPPGIPGIGLDGGLPPGFGGGNMMQTMLMPGPLGPQQQMIFPQAGIQNQQLGMMPLGNAPPSVAPGMSSQPTAPSTHSAPAGLQLQPPPMQRDHSAINRMQTTSFYQQPMQPQTSSHKQRQQMGANNAFAGGSKRVSDESSAAQNKKAKVNDEKKDPLGEHLRTFLRQQVNRMARGRDPKQPFDVHSAYELSKLPEDFQRMFGYSLDVQHGSTKHGKLSELVYQHAKDIVSMRATRTRGTMLYPVGKSFVESGAAGSAAQFTAGATPSPTASRKAKQQQLPSPRTSGPSTQAGSPAAPPTSTSAHPSKPQSTPKPQHSASHPSTSTPASTAQTTMPPPASTPVTPNSTASGTAAAGASGTAAAAPTARPGAAVSTFSSAGLEPKLSSALPLFRRKLFAACYSVAKEAEYLVRSSIRRDTLKLVLPNSAKTVEQAMKVKEYKQHVLQVQYAHALPMLATYQDIAAAVDSTWEQVQEVIDTGVQSNVLLSNGATVTMDKAGMAVLLPSLRGLKAHSTMRDLVSLLGEKLLEYTPSCVAAAPSEPGLKLDKLKQAFLSKFKYHLDPSIYGYAGWKELLECELLQQYVEMLRGEGAAGWLLRPRFDPLADVREFLEAQMLLLFAKQKEKCSFVLQPDQGFDLDALQTDFALHTLYEINPVPIGFPDWHRLVAANTDICVLRPQQQEGAQPPHVHPSPLLHLKLLLQESVKGVTPIYDEQGQRVPGVATSDGYNMDDILEDFEGIYGYPLQLGEWGMEGIAEALGRLQDCCSTVSGPDRRTYLFPPRRGAANGFLPQGGGGLQDAAHLSKETSSGVSTRQSCQRPAVHHCAACAPLIALFGIWPYLVLPWCLCFTHHRIAMHCHAPALLLVACSCMQCCVQCYVKFRAQFCVQCYVQLCVQFCQQFCCALPPTGSLCCEMRFTGCSAALHCVSCFPPVHAVLLSGCAL